MIDKPQHIAHHHWQALLAHAQKINGVTLQQLFIQEPLRHKTFATQLGAMYVDYSKHHITTETMGLLVAMAEDVGLSDSIGRLFQDDAVSCVGRDTIMYTALRAPPNKQYLFDGMDVSGLVHQELRHIRQFVDALHAGNIRGYTGKPIKTLLNIGIGGSGLGPKFVSDALVNSAVTDVAVCFVSNVDAAAIDAVLTELDPETTLLLISSKSFRTKETLLNAETAIRWLKDSGCHVAQEHLLAVTANPDAARKMFGVKEENIFHIWPWVGGRYSIWSAIGLPVAVKIGMQNFYDFLNGALVVDEHFRTQPLMMNLPVILALIDIWYLNFLQAKSIALFPYNHALSLMPEYIGQLMMESNGKQVDNDGRIVAYDTATVVWGKTGADAQHAYLQCLHQGTGLHLSDFIVGLGRVENKKHYQEMIANCLAQSEALMNGKVDAAQPSYKNIPGNRPSTTILLDELSPTTLGSLLSLYEHRCFVQACIWNINPFDQWGVELGKQLSTSIYTELSDSTVTGNHDASTAALISHCLDTIKHL